MSKFKLWFSFHNVVVSRIYDKNRSAMLPDRAISRVRKVLWNLNVVLSMYICTTRGTSNMYLLSTLTYIIVSIDLANIWQLLKKMVCNLITQILQLLKIMVKLISDILIGVSSFLYIHYSVISLFFFGRWKIGFPAIYHK